MINSMEWSWFRVLIKVEQVNDNLFLNTCENNSNSKLHEWMRWRWVDTKWWWSERPSKVNTRDVRQRDAQIRDAQERAQIVQIANPNK